MTAVQDMTGALISLTEHDTRPRCADQTDRWISEDYRDRQVAARLCHDCTLIDICGAYADEIGARFGVWAGVDRTQSSWSTPGLATPGRQTQHTKRPRIPATTRTPHAPNCHRPPPPKIVDGPPANDPG